MRDSIGSPIFTEPRLAAVVKPFRSKHPATVEATGWLVKQVSRKNGWATYKHGDSAWYLWNEGGFLLLTQTEPGEAYSGDYYIKEIEDGNVCFQGSYGYKSPDAEQQLEVYVWSPFDIILSRLAEVLRLHPDLTDLIPERNLMDLSGGGIFKVTKERRASSDYPEIAIEPKGGNYAVLDSTSMLVRQEYVVRVLAAEQVVSRYFFPVKWSCLQALIALLENPNSGCMLDLFFLRNTRIPNISDAMNEFLKPGWKSEISVSAEILIARSIIRSI